MSRLFGGRLRLLALYRPLDPSLPLPTEPELQEVARVPAGLPDRAPAGEVAIAGTDLHDVERRGADEFELAGARRTSAADPLVSKEGRWRCRRTRRWPGRWTQLWNATGIFAGNDPLDRTLMRMSIER